MAVHLYLAAEVLELDQPALEVHEQRAAQLVLRPVDLDLAERGRSRCQRERVQLAADDVEHGIDARRQTGGADAEQATVGIGVVEGDAALDPAVLVQHVRVQARVHALARPAGAKGTAAAEKGLQNGEGVDVRRGDR